MQRQDRKRFSSAHKDFTTTSDASVLQYYANRLNSDWVFIFTQIKDNLPDILRRLTKQTGFTNNGYNGYKMKKAGKKYRHYIYPSFCDILKPFRLIDLEDVEIIFLGHEPCVDGTDTGLFLDSDPQIYPSINEFGKPAENINSSSLNQAAKRISNLVSHVIQYRNNENAFSKQHPTYKNSDWYRSGEFDIHTWIDEGVLPLYINLTTTCFNTKNDHDVYWSDFVADLLKTITAYNSSIVIVAFGEEVSQFLHKYNITDNIIYTSDADVYANVGATFDNLFVNINKYLSSTVRENYMISW